MAAGHVFGPFSRRKRPKQLLTLLGKNSLLEQTVARIQPVIPWGHIYIFTSEVILRKVRQLLPRIPSQQIVGEPASRNTAPRWESPHMKSPGVTPKGSWWCCPPIRSSLSLRFFGRYLRAACRVASTAGRSVVLGLKPTRPDTGFGYIRLGQRKGKVAGHKVFHVASFTEKPTLAVARRYVSSGRYLWNGGMFIWKASTLIENLERFQPEMASQLRQIANAGGVRGRAFRRNYPRFQKISIDYALMEKISNLYALPADIGWNDVGSWAVVYELANQDSEKNVRPSASLSLDSHGNMVVSPKKYVVTIGVHDLIVVESDDALLVCARARSQEVAKAVQELARLGRHDLL